MSKHKILFVDDESNVLKSLKRLFIDADYKIFTAPSGDEGLKIIKENSISLVISDYRMPEMNGVQFLSEVKKLYPDTIRIILSGYADVMAIVEAINDGEVYKFLAKPWNDQELLTTVDRAIEHFELKEKHNKVLDELKNTNNELRSLTKNLEGKVQERTQSLEIRNRALIITQRILNELPVGVLCIDSSGMIVYMNEALKEFIDISKLQLGCTLEKSSNELIYKIAKLSQQEQKCNYYKIDDKSNICVVCTPVEDNTGVILTFGNINIDNKCKMFEMDKLTKVNHD
ncbi:MAG: histidine kinase [Candidatus Zixiibacteriota bacterium]|nr:MAG: histidine kinase [candidate division Zixibacteria bacterium]